MRAAKRGFDLERLLAPLTPAEFRRDLWERKPEAVRRRGAGFYSGLLSIADLDSVVCLTGAASTDNDMRLARARGGKFESRPIARGADGRPDVYALYQAHREGFTLIVNRIDARWRPVAALCRGLEAELHHRVSANLYFTPGREQGFTPHFDTHDVFILQLEGSKTWRLYGSVPLPLADDDRPVTRRELGRPSRELVLEAGDLLYIPRGRVHEAVSRDSSSLHLTVGLHVLRWFDLAQDALLHAAREDARLREALPPGFMGPAVAAGPMKRKLAELLASVAAGASAGTAVDELAGRLLKRGAPAPDGHFSQLDRVPDLKDGTVVARRAGLACVAYAADGEAGIRFPGNRVAGPSVIGPALRFVAANARFRVRDLPGLLSPAAKRVLVGRLIREGLLTPAV